MCSSVPHSLLTFQRQLQCSERFMMRVVVVSIQLLLVCLLLLMKGVLVVKRGEAMRVKGLLEWLGVAVGAWLH